MTQTKIALLTDRGLVRVAGDGAAKLLQGLVTNDMDRLQAAPAIHAGLLSPQGKILFEFFIVKDGGAFLLETARDKTADLVRRLMMYKLRANAVIEDVSSQYTVAAFWDGEPAEGDARFAFPDPRLPALGFRARCSFANDWALGESGAEPASAEDYHARRVGLGVPEGGKDYALGDTFPHEALFDQLGGVSFAKGCFIGQEVVSRMEHRGAARKRIVQVTGAAPLPPPGTPVRAGAVPIGAMGSSAGARGLALLRLDRVAEAQDKGEPIHADGVTLAVAVPPFARFSIRPDVAPPTTP